MRLVALSALALGSAAACAQDAPAASGSRAGLSITPRLSLTETWTDNLNLRQDKDQALVTEVSPGISIRNNVGRLRGSLDYSLNSILYLKTDEKNRVQHALAGQALAELLDRSLFVDMRASISQQVTSAFGQQTVDNTLSNANRNEVANVSVSPYLKGQLAGLVSYSLRANLNEVNTKDSSIGDSRTRGGSLQLGGLSSGAVGWYATASKQKTSYKVGNDSSIAQANAGLTYQPDIDWRFNVSAGRERSDYLNGIQQSSGSYGGGVFWTPTERTKIAADYQRHSYGNGHTLSLDHRMAHSTWRISDIQSVQLGSDQNSIGPRSNYTLFYEQFASLVPDPIQRDLFVRAFLQALGLSPDAIATSGFLAAGPSLMRAQEFSFSLTGARLTMTALFGRTETRQLGSATGAGDLGLASRIIQRGGTVSLAYRLTPTASTNLSYVQQDSRGEGSNLSSSLHSLTANWSDRLGPYLSFSVGARHAWFDSPTAPYRENAVFANLVQQF
ncbi:MAG: TIGR03016 family PEP-CTERM system-associated outer membrane protein [Burkholderiaceae bacterium]